MITDDDWDEQMTARAKPFATKPKEDPPTPFSDTTGWTATDDYRVIENPNFVWFKLWTKRHIRQRLFKKWSVYGEEIGKWVGGGVEEDAML